MKRFSFFLLLLIQPVIVFSQDEVKMTKKEKKEQKAIEKDKALREFYFLLLNRRFVIEADRVYNESGESFMIESTTNFFIADRFILIGNF